ncbi:hypothetical protein N5D83_02465 [Pseudomonas chengduensis]|nr:hypothetical protein [Pseudomonas chengduensis]MDH1865682.1 hypothetical protein [Pseudomonas chengduensis]
MNPRIMKKLSKRIAVHAEALGYSIDLDGPCAVELTEKGTSRKISHRNRRRWDGSVRLGPMLTLQRTPFFCWTDYGPDGGEGDGAIAWEHMRHRVRSQIDDLARDWSHPAAERGEWPPYIDGKAPRLPRSTPEVLRAIEHYALVELERKAIRRLAAQQRRAAFMAGAKP